MIRMVDLIRRKRDGATLTPAEVGFFVGGVVDGSIPEYQSAALLMAIFFRGLGSEELAALTDEMLHSGEVMRFAEIAAPKVDKHSTGGVGDKISLPLAPAVAACGVAVPMISGRGLGHTGGTLDKLESIPGLRTDLDGPRMHALLGAHGLVFAGQSASIAPADRRLYALRDVTGTVESIPLITASILSKKLAEGIDGLVLDVKVGRGAFMKTLAEARLLARTLVDVARRAGTRAVALLTRMEAPLGRAIGNLCEVHEAIEVLRGGGPPDTRALTLRLGAEMLVLGGAAADTAAGEAAIARALDTGAAIDRWSRIVAAQGGDLAAIEDAPYAPVEHPFLAPREGYVTRMDAEALGLLAMSAGAGRARKEDAIDPGVALLLHRKPGDRVVRGEPIATLHARRHDGSFLERLGQAIAVGDEPPAETPLVLERLE